MEYKKKGAESNSNIIYIKLFLLIVIAIFVGSLLYKGFQLYTKRSFKGSSFTALVVGKNPYIIYINSHMNLFTVAQVKNFQYLSKGNTIHNSIVLSIPIQGIIVADEDSNLFASQLLSFPKFFGMISHGNFSHMNKLDLFKMYLLSKSVPNTSNNTIVVDQKNLSDSFDEKLYSVLKDEDIINDKTSIEVVNTTDVSGLGSQVSRMLKNVGFNVISVTSDSPISHSKIIANVEEKNVSLKALYTVLPFEVESQGGSSVADITVMLGNDIKQNL